METICVVEKEHQKEGTVHLKKQRKIHSEFVEAVLLGLKDIAEGRIKEV